MVVLHCIARSIPRALAGKSEPSDRNPIQNNIPELPRRRTT
jgi:hypothetical protein